MSEALFQAAVSNVLASEGGYVNHPSDPGGETNFGISKRAYPHLDIRNLTRADAVDIYRRDYWAKVPESLPDDLRWMVFDACVNHGAGAALGWLKVNPTMASFTAARLKFYTAISTWQTFGRGWMRRVAHVLEGISQWQESGQPQRLGQVEVLVLHNVGPRELGELVTEAHNGTGQVRLGPAIISRTGTRKIDARLVDPRVVD